MRHVEVFLASASPRRLAILRMLGLEPRVLTPGSVERAYAPGEAPADYAVAQAEAKLRSVPGSASGLTIAADTIVVLDGRVLGKPEDAAEARTMLRALSGREHDVITGVAVGVADAEASGWERTRVAFRPLEDEEIALYVAGGEPLDKAGAYGIQGRGAALVREVDGCYFNVVGLPVAKLLDLLGRIGLRYAFERGVVAGEGGSDA